EIEDVARSSRDIDSITDLLLTDTERATRHEDARQRMADNQRKREQFVEKIAALEKGVAEIDRAWKRSWISSGLEPRGGTEMLHWRDRFDEIVSRLDKCDLQRADIQALSAGLDASKEAVIAFLESVDREANRTLSAEVLFREAKGRFDQLQVAWGDAKARS